MKAMRILIGLFLVFLLVGCSANQRITRIYGDPNNPTRITSEVVEEVGIGESANLRHHYAALNGATTALVNMHKETQYSNTESATLGAILTQMLIAQVMSTRSPNTAVDLFMALGPHIISAVPNYIMLLSDDFGQRQHTSDIKIVGNNNNLINRSAMGNGANSRAQFWMRDYADVTFTVPGQGASGTLDMSRPIDYNWMYQRGNTDRDTSLF